MNNAPLSRVERAAEQFRRMAETARADHAPLYEHLAARVADDQALLEIAVHARPSQSITYLFFDAVHYLVLGGSEHELARYYASVTEHTLDATEAFPAFRDFCLGSAAEIRELIASHNNQTNEVGRMAAMLPALHEVAIRAGRRPLGIVEVGPSAGLNLVFDRYYFDYRTVQWGDPLSPVRVYCELEDGLPPPLQDGLPSVTYRIGLDIEPVDLMNDDAARWMLSSTWPDHRDLSLMQRQAIDVLRLDPPRLVQGDALEVGPLLADVPAELTLCVYQSFMLNHLPPEGQQRFLDILAAESRRRPVYFVSMLGSGGGRRASVDLHSWVDGHHETHHLVEGHSHGRSIRWLG